MWKKITKKLVLFALTAAMVIAQASPAAAATADKYGEKKALKTVSTGKVTMNNGCKHTYVEASNGVRYFKYCYSCMDGLAGSTPTNHQSTVTIDGVKYTLCNYSINSSKYNTGAVYSNVIKAASDSKKTVAAKSVKLSASSATLKVGATKTLTATVSPSNATSKAVSWISSNTSVATVSTSGKVTAKKAGTATITAVTNNGKSASCKITVKAANVAVTKVTLSASSASLTVGKTKTLTATVTPSNATNKTITWSSSNTSVATVSSSGKVTAKKAGTATITAKTSNGKKATCKVTVKAASSSTTSTSSGSSSGKYLDVSSAYTLVNNFRTSSGVWYWNSNNKTKTYFNKSGYTTLSKLSKNSKLETVAKTRAKELATSYSHTRPNGTSCFTLYPCSTAAENIACGSSTILTASSVEELWEEADAYYSGQGHRRNILNSSYNAVGIACYQVNGVNYWVMALGKM